MYASRNADVVFSNINLTVDGVKVTLANADEIMGSGSGNIGGGVIPEPPKTGDNAPIGAYTGLAVTSIIVLAALAVVEKKRRRVL